MVSINNNFIQIFKKVVIRSGGVDKTTTIHTMLDYLDKTINNNINLNNKYEIYQCTKFIDYILFFLVLKNILLQTWDLQGQRPNFLDFINESMLGNVNLILLMHAKNNYNSINNLFLLKITYIL